MDVMTSTLGADLLSVVARINRLATQRARLPLPFAQARLLSTIEDQGATRISDLAALDHCSQPTMTTQVRRLEDAGLVSRAVDPDDARAVLIRITPEGVETLRQVRVDRIWSGSTPRTGRRSATPSACCVDFSRTRPHPLPPKNR
jgi:DNA-binding MarR family transcriptional regulator